VPDGNSIQAIQLTYDETDELRFLSELDSWCPVSPSLPGASLTRRTEWLAARVALKRLLGVLSLNLALKTDSAAPYPVLVDSVTLRPSDYFVSWAHTHKCVVAGVSREPVGVDVEAASRSVSKVLKRIASEEEISRTREIRSHDGQPIPAELAIWCGKEAMAKATGLGMKWGLKNFEFTSEHRGVWLIKTDKEGPRKVSTAAVSLFLREGWLVAFAGTQPQLLKGPTWN
jgi:phosphopantetheinyl transferase